MSKERNLFLQIISDICREQRISLATYDEQRVFELLRGNVRRFIWRTKFDLNNGLSVKLADNKYECSLVLKSSGIPSLDYTKLPTTYADGCFDFTHESYELLRNASLRHGKIVVKPNAGYNGKDIFMCTNLKDATNALDRISFPCKFFVMSPALQVSFEYRVVLLDGCGLLVYRKEPPFIIGDGTSTVMELAYKLEPDLASNDASQIDSRVADVGEKVYIGWQHNLSKGARSEIITDKAQLKSPHNSSIISPWFSTVI